MIFRLLATGLGKSRQEILIFTTNSPTAQESTPQTQALFGEKRNVLLPSAPHEIIPKADHTDEPKQYGGPILCFFVRMIAADITTNSLEISSETYCWKILQI